VEGEQVWILGVFYGGQDYESALRSEEDRGVSRTRSIDIDQLTEAELIDLNHRIVARLRFLRELQAPASMLELRIGERVRFHPEGQAAVTGVISRYNKKSVSVLTDDGQRWTVAPQFLERVQNGSPERAGQVIDRSAENRRTSMLTRSR
jgi:hypothetical protein